MFDRRLVRSVLLQIDEAIDTIQRRSAKRTHSVFSVPSVAKNCNL
jgi:hypothetical protein